MAASLVFHALVLAVLGWRAAPRLAQRDAALRPDVELTLVRPPPSTTATSRTPDARAGTKRPATSATLQAQRRSPSPVPFAENSPAPAAAPVPAAAAAQVAAQAAAQGFGVGLHPGALSGAEAGGDFKGFLRAGVGCAHRDGVGLTRVEREACDQKAGDLARTGPGGLLIPDDKLAGYARQAEADAKRRALREGPLLRPFVPCPPAQAGSNLGLGCLPKEASHTVVRF